MRHYAGSAMMLLLTTAVIVGSYTVNLKVSAERAQLERLRRTLVTDARSIRDLQAELRTRARLPEMQRWNDNVLQMSAPAAGQYLRNPVQLAGYAVQGEAEPAEGMAGAMQASPSQSVQQAVTVPTPVAQPSLTAPIVRAAYRPAPVAEQGSASRPELRAAPRAAVPVELHPQPKIMTVAYRPSIRRAPPLVIIPDSDDVGAPVDLLSGGGQ